MQLFISCHRLCQLTITERRTISTKAQQKVSCRIFWWEELTDQSTKHIMLPGATSNKPGKLLKRVALDVLILLWLTMCNLVKPEPLPLLLNGAGRFQVNSET